MKMHANARLSLKGRELLVDRVENAGWSLSAAAEAAGISDRTARKWIARYRTEGPGGLLDRSSAPVVVANRTEERRVEVIAALRRLRMTGAEIAECLGMALSTVSGILTRIGLGKLGRLGLEPARRYERARPGELIHIDIKKLGRIQVMGHAVTGNRAQHARRTRVGNDGRLLGTAGGSSFTSRSTTPPDWPTSRYSPTRKRSRRSGSFAALSLTSPATASPSSGCLLTTAAPTAQPCTRSPAARFRSATSAPGPTDPRPTAKPSASSAPSSAAGPTARSTETALSATQRSPAGSTSTIAADHTAPSATSHP